MAAYLLSKVVIFLVSPLGTALVLLSLGLVLVLFGRARRLAGGLLLAGLAWLWLWSLPAVSDWLVHQGESAFPPARAESLPAAEAIVVLGGALVPAAPGSPYPDMSAAADRAWHAARLYRAGKAPLIVASGGSDPQATPMSEAEALRMLLTDLGVPSRAILLEPNSRNTRQNAQFTAAVLRQRNVHRILLVTSALHMRRARMEFEQAGLQVVPAATDHAQPKAGGVLRWLPEAEALDASGRAMKERVGTWGLELAIAAKGAFSR